MSQQVRILLKAVALGRYLLSNHRLSKLSTGAKDIIKGDFTVGTLTNAMNPIRKDRFRRLFQTKRLIWYLVFGASASLVGYEYSTHRNSVPITDRKHFVVIPREMELKYQDTMVSNLEAKFDEANERILDSSDKRVVFIHQILSKLKDACIYFSPECKEYMDKMKVIVVEDDDVNAYTTMGSIIVIYTGLLDHFQKMVENQEVSNLEECIAGVLAHELSHSLSRHPVESMLRWTGWAYYIYITLVPDFVFMPLLKSIFDKRLSRAQEMEADFQALYLLKRSGYDASSMIKTLSLLPEEQDDIELVSIAKESIDDHPRIVNRVTHLQDKIFWFEKDFKTRFEVISQKDTKDSSFFSYLWQITGFF
ncbi:hypothetical protein WA538_005080 [Blastocystis sp. DL]